MIHLYTDTFIFKCKGAKKMKQNILIVLMIFVIGASIIPGIMGETVVSDTTPPEITIVNPVEGYFHFSGIQLFPTPLDLIGDTMGFGGFRVRPVQAIITDDVDSPEELTVVLYANDVKERDMQYNSDNDLFEGKWIGPDLGTFTMKIVAEDSSGNSKEETMIVWYFCFVPE